MSATDVPSQTRRPSWRAIAQGADFSAIAFLPEEQSRVTGGRSPHMTVVSLLTDGTTTKLQIDEILSCRLLFVLAKLTKLAIISVLRKAGNRRGRSTTRR